MSKTPIILLLSGGMDSVVLLYELVGDGELVHCVTRAPFYWRHILDARIEQPVALAIMKAVSDGK